MPPTTSVFQGVLDAVQAQPEGGWLSSQVLIAIIGVVGTVAGGLIAWRASSRQTDAQMEQKSQDELWSRYWQQQREIDELRLYIDQLLDDRVRLHYMLLGAGITPPPLPQRRPTPRSAEPGSD
jgi:type II secretory pathway component PulL